MCETVSVKICWLICASITNFSTIVQHLAAFPWYGGKMSRTQAEQHMTGKPDGTFLVRDSASHQGYSLSVRFTEIRHVVIIKKGGKFGFSEPTTFSSLEALVKHFEQESLACYNAELETKLSYPYKTAPDEVKSTGDHEEDVDEEDIYISNREALRHEREYRAKAQHQLQFTDIYDQVKDVQENRKAQSVICAMLKEQKLKHESIYVSGPDLTAVKENYSLLKQRLFDAERNLEKLDNSVRRVEEENMRRRQSGVLLCNTYPVDCGVMTPTILYDRVDPIAIHNSMP